MASTIKRVTLEELRKRKPDVDRAKLDATTEEDIRQQMIEDGEDPDTEPDPAKVRLVVPAAKVRDKLGLSQHEFADLIKVPIGTVRNWEQGRVMPDPAARSLLVLLWREPEAALRALRVA